MPERVTFTKKSADRIATVVKRVENMPAAEPIQQRRRAGGYRMESLFEVTAVQTGEETVTLKRVQDTDDNLNDRSETEDVAYDLDNVPSVGDRGLIVRLGDRTRFFFRPQRRIRYHATEAATVKSTSPDSTFDYNADRHTIIRTETLDQQLVYKFPSPIKATGGFNFGDICLGETVAVIPGVGTNKSFVVKCTLTSGEVYIGVGIVVRMIGEDFDCSTVTYNSLSGLSSPGHSHFANLDLVRIRAAEWAAYHTGADTPPNLFMISGGSIDVPAVYGMYARFNHWPDDTENISIIDGYCTGPIRKAGDANRVWLDVEFK